MQILKLLCFGAIALISLTASAGRVDALQKLQQAFPNEKWDKKTSLKIDIDCDGKKDLVFLSQTPNYAYVGLVLGRKNGPTVFTQRIAIGDPKQDSLCAAPAEIGTESLDYDPTEMVGETPGFKTSKSCKAFVLAGGECDMFHFFWNHRDNKLDWWRL